MPRDGSGNYTYPPGTPGIPDTTIESAKYNGYIADIQQDLNLPRPIVAGGTGATSATAARDNLDAERAGAQVTNYDSHVFENGSFWSAPGTTAAPDAGGAGAFVGAAVIYGTDQQNIVITARNYLGTTVPPTQWVRVKKAGVWGVWAVELSDTFVNVTGDTMTGNLSISKASPLLILNKVAEAQSNGIFGMAGSQNRWLIMPGADDGNSNFIIRSYDNVGAFRADVFGIDRNTGKISITGGGGLAVYGATTTQLMQAGQAPFSTLAGGAPISIGFTGAGAQAGIIMRNANDSSTAISFSNAAGTQCGSITQFAASVAFNTSSDERLKEDLKSFDAGNIIDDTNVYNFAWKATGERAYGVIAQQANEVYPEAVTYTKENDWWGIDYSRYVPVILQELKALRARVAELEARLEGKPA